MARKKMGSVWRQGIPRPPDLGGVCTIFTRDEIPEWFRELGHT